MGPTVSLRDRLRCAEPLFGVWSTIPGPIAAEVIVGPGVDYVVVDLQHGGAGEADLAGMLAAIAAGGAYPLVRPRSPAFADIGRALDLGAHGVVVPNVDSAEQAVAAAAACAYPPAGTRSFGLLRPGPAEPACLVMVASRAARDVRYRRRQTPSPRVPPDHRLLGRRRLDRWHYRRLGRRPG